MYGEKNIEKALLEKGDSECSYSTGTNGAKSVERRVVDLYYQSMFGHSWLFSRYALL
jgi:hypothetical protein